MNSKKIPDVQFLKAVCFAIYSLELQDHRSQKSDAQGYWIDQNEEDGGKENQGKHSQYQHCFPNRQLQLTEGD